MLDGEPGMLLALLAPSALFAASSTHQARPSSGFPVFWHVGSGYNTVNGTVPAPGWPRSLAAGWQCDHPGAFWPSVNVTEHFGVENCTRVQCGPACTNPPLCQDWQMGLFPSLKAGVPVNGGVPQAANLSAHLAELRATVVHFVPDPDWDGLAVFDFEEWTNIWELMVDGGTPGGWHSIAYQNYSIELERRAHPRWSEGALVAAAKANFETAATEFLVETLRTCSALRPKAKWGFYGYPQEVVCKWGLLSRFELHGWWEGCLLSNEMLCVARFRLGRQQKQSVHAVRGASAADI